MIKALNAGQPIVVKLGQCVADDGSDEAGGMVWRREWHRQQVAQLVSGVSVLTAEYTKREDYDKIVKVMRPRGTGEGP